MSAEFDPNKDAANIKQHGVSLAEGDGALMVVVHAPQGSRSRIISVRKPDPKERRNYEKGV
ncbi:MAG: hypothetical protein WD851_15950 [Pirellulales bacterium]